MYDRNTKKMDEALARLQRILPLKQRQEDCGKPLKALHQHILRSFVDRGRIPGREELSGMIADLGEAVRVLKDFDMVTFSGNGEPVGAYPFTMEDREHKVQVNGHQLNAMCALDALAISPMFDMRTRISSRCRHTGDVVFIQQSGYIIENPHESGSACLGVDWGAENADNCCADSLCTEMVFLRDGEIALQWRSVNSQNRETFTLPEAIEFASAFFVPLMC